MIYNRVVLWLLYGKRFQGPDSFLFVEVRILEVGKWNARMIIDQAEEKGREWVTVCSCMYCKCLIFT